MTKFAAFCATPITYGAYLKLCGICLGVAMIEYLVFYAVWMRDESLE